MSAVRVVRGGYSFETPGPFIAIDDERMCRCGRRPAGIGSTEDAARLALSRIRRCHHGRWYLKALFAVTAWWGRRAE